VPKLFSMSPQPASASGRAAPPSTIHNTASQHFFGRQSTGRPQSFDQHTAGLQQSMQRNHFSPLAAGGRPIRSSAADARSMPGAGAGKPSAGSPLSGREPGTGREMNPGVTRSAGNQPPANQNANRSGSRPFAPPSNGNVRPEIAQPQRPSPPSSFANRAEQASPSSREPNRSEWKTFTPPSHSESPNRGGSNAAPAGRADNGSFWNRTAPSSNYSRQSGSSNYERGSSSRPQLNMRQPIVQPRSSGGYGSGGSRSAPPSYGGSRGGYSGGGSHSAPPSYGGNRGGYSGGGSHSAPPSYGGSRGGYSGGGSHSAPPSYGGSHGGYSGGGSHSAPSSGGGNHSSGGGSSHSSGSSSSHSNSNHH